MQRQQEDLAPAASADGENAFVVLRDATYGEAPRWSRARRLPSILPATICLLHNRTRELNLAVLPWDIASDPPRRDRMQGGASRCGEGTRATSPNLITTGIGARDGS